jgi:hypothetical protein
MAKIIVPRLKKGDLVTLNTKGVEHFSNKRKRLISLSMSYPSYDKFDYVGIVISSAYDMKGRVNVGKSKLIVGVAWCHEPPKITKITAKWLKKVYHH